MTDYINGALQAIHHPVFYHALSAARISHAYDTFADDIQVPDSNVKMDDDNLIFTGQFKGKVIEQFNTATFEIKEQALALTQSRKNFLKCTAIAFLIAALVFAPFIAFLSVGLVGAAIAFLIVHCCLTYRAHKIESEFATQGALLAQDFMLNGPTDALAIKFKAFEDNYKLGHPPTSYTDYWDMPPNKDPVNAPWRAEYGKNIEDTSYKVKERLKEIHEKWKNEHDDNYKIIVLGLFKKTVSNNLVVAFARELFIGYREVVNQAIDEAKESVVHAQAQPVPVPQGGGVG